MEDYMPKPVSLEKLRAMMAHWRPAPPRSAAGQAAEAVAVR
jgi:hypothetical protein